jgi:23S rRNA pseudouridine2605 synthase
MAAGVSVPSKQKPEAPQSQAPRSKAPRRKTAWSPTAKGAAAVALSADDDIRPVRAPRKPTAPAEASRAAANGDRIAKVIARAGICSRRDAEKMIAEGRVTLNGEKVTSPARNVTATDQILVDAKPLAQPEAARMWRYHKPSGLVTTHKDEKGRPTVFANLPKSLGRVVSVGRLDFNSEGLLLLTNDGDIARRMEVPSAGWTRVYRVRLFGKVTQAELDRLAEGTVIDGVKYGPIIADLERSKGVYAWARVSLKEGKNREVKRVMESLGLKVARLIRTSYGPFQLGHLAEGQTEEIPARLWREKLGIGRKKRDAQ